MGLKSIFLNNSLNPLKSNSRSKFSLVELYFHGLVILLHFAIFDLHSKVRWRSGSGFGCRSKGPRFKSRPKTVTREENASHSKELNGSSVVSHFLEAFQTSLEFAQVRGITPLHVEALPWLNEPRIEKTS